MMKRLLLLSMALLLLVGAAWAGDGLHVLKPTKVTIGSPDGPELDEANFIISRTSDATAEYYLGSGAVGDTMCVHFQPLAACEIYSAEIQWFNDGPYQAFVWEYSEAAEGQYADGRAPERGTSEVSPLGPILFGPFNTSAEGTQDWEAMFTVDDLLNGEPIWLEDGRPFIVGFVKTAGEQPQPLADDVSSRGFTYTWFGGPWMAEDYDYLWGSYSSNFGGTIVDVMMRTWVDYPEGAPPIIGSMAQLPNTVNGSKNISIEIEIIDDNGWTTDEANWMIQKNENAPVAVPLTDDDNDDMFTADYTIEGDVGDVFRYWVEATDDEGQVNSSQDNLLFFEIINLPMADADVLVIDHASDYQSQLLATLDDMGWYYAFYDVSANKGVDEFVLSEGDFSAVLVFDWGAGSMTTRGYADSPYAAYLQNGGNLFYADQDFFYGAGEPGEPAFSAGDLAYDAFGIADGLNDPQPTDTTFFGEFDDPLTDPFADDPFVVYFDDSSAQSWADAVNPVPDAVAIFIGEMEGNVTGIRYENDWGGKTVYLALDATFAVNKEGDDEEMWRMTDQWQTLMGNVIDWFGASTDVEEGVVSQPSEFNLSQNYPNPFNPSTEISFTLPATSEVKLTVFNSMGQQVATLVNGKMGAGQQVVSFDASNLASGLYFYTLNAGEFTATRKMMLLK